MFYKNVYQRFPRSGRSRILQHLLILLPMNRFALPLLLAGTFLLATPGLAQTKTSKSGDGWGAPAAAPKKAAAAPKKVAPAAAAPAPVTAAPVAEPVAAPAADAVSSQAGFGGGGVSAAVGSNQPGGSVVAPGFTAAPSHRVTTDYRGRPLAPYVKRSVRRPDPVVAPAPMPEPEPEPVAVTPEPVAAPAPAAAAANATKASGGATAAKKAAAPAAKKAAPAKKKDDGWGSGGSGW